jgi:hypothetical protein
LLLALTGLATPQGAAAQGIGWTISASATDPFVNTGTPGMPGTLTTLHIWYACNTTPPAGPGVGMTAMECDLTGAPFSPLMVMNGFIGSSLDKILLGVGGCPMAPVPAASLLYLNTGAGLDIHFIPSPDNGYNRTVDCGGNAWPNQCVGYNEIGPPVQNFVGEMCGFGTVSVERESWGGVKALYR